MPLLAFVLLSVSMCMGLNGSGGVVSALSAVGEHHKVPSSLSITKGRRGAEKNESKGLPRRKVALFVVLLGAQLFAGGCIKCFVVVLV